MYIDSISTQDDFLAQSLARTRPRQSSFFHLLTKRYAASPSLCNSTRALLWFRRTIDAEIWQVMQITISASIAGPAAPALHPSHAPDHTRDGEIPSLADNHDRPARTPTVSVLTVTRFDVRAKMAAAAFTELNTTRGPSAHCSLWFTLR